MDLLYRGITEKIIGAYYDVYNKLGFGFLERVYQNALYYELLDRDLECKAQERIDVFYYDRRVGEYYADIVVNNIVILELKATRSLCSDHEKQLINYLKATKYEVGLLLNFGEKPEYKRKIFYNGNK